jgi:hypothetical protein
MAGEAKAVMSLTTTGGPGPVTGTVTSDWATSQGSDDRWHSIGTTEESITFTDISVNGWVHLYNTDPTNYVEVGFSTGVYGIKLGAGQRAQFRLNAGATMYLKANTASCRVRCTHIGG